MTRTVEEAIAKFGVEIDDHLDRQSMVPVLSGLQFQGDVAVVPRAWAAAVSPVPPLGVPVVRGESGGNTHLLLADGAVAFDSRTPRNDDLLLGVVTVAEGATAYLAHPEHAYTGIAPGTYELRRQREQADAVRLVAD
jgi:hypothetical protein